MRASHPDSVLRAAGMMLPRTSIMQWDLDEIQLRRLQEWRFPHGSQPPCTCGPGPVHGL